MLEFCSIGFLLPGGSFTRFMYRSKSCQQPCLALDIVLFLFEVRSASLECYESLEKATTLRISGRSRSFFSGYFYYNTPLDQG